MRPRRYLGLELFGARNQKTALAALEYYPKENKIFLLDIYEKVVSEEDQSSDAALVDAIDELNLGVARMGVNVSFKLTPCIVCTRKTCPLPQKCTVQAVKWMREYSSRYSQTKDILPYVQRPFELYARNAILPKLDAHARFEIDETLGGTKGPLTARMHFLKRHLTDIPVIEVWPKLTIAVLSRQLKISKREFNNYRKIEEGVHARGEILDALVNEGGVFIYERDLRKLASSLATFDAFICAYTALLFDLGKCVKPPKGFPIDTGWVEHPAV